MNPRIRIQEAIDAITIYVNDECTHISLQEDGYPGYYFKKILESLGYTVNYEEVY